MLLHCLPILASVTQALAVHLNRVPAPAEAGVLEYRQKQFNIQDLQYYSHVYVGKQMLHAVMDTGSIDLIVISDKCMYQCGATSRLYHPQKSSSYTHGVDHQVISYGSGDLKGREAYDSFAIGPLKADSQAFWEITDARMPLLRHSDFEVIVGLGPFEPNTPIMTLNGDNEMAYAGMLDTLNVTRYGFCLMSEFGAPGYLIWNDQSIIQYPQLFQELRMIDRDYWMASLSDVRLGSRPIACRHECAAILDSGTSLIALPDEHYTVLQHAIWKLGPQCEDISNLPNLYFKLDNVEMFLPPDAYLGEVEGFAQKHMSRHFVKKKSKSKYTCQEALMRVDMDSSHGSTWVLGMPFFRSYYSIFQQGSPTRMYVAPADSECKPQRGKSSAMFPSQTRTTARRINAEIVRFSPGIQKHILQHGKKSMPHSEKGTSQHTVPDKSQHQIPDKTNESQGAVHDQVPAATNNSQREVHVGNHNSTAPDAKSNSQHKVPDAKNSSLREVHVGNHNGTAPDAKNSSHREVLVGNQSGAATDAKSAWREVHAGKRSHGKFKSHH